MNTCRSTFKIKFLIITNVFEALRSSTYVNRDLKIYDGDVTVERRVREKPGERTPFYARENLT